MLVTLQMPVVLHDESVRLYTRAGTKMNCPPFIGMSLAGIGIEDNLGLIPPNKAKNIVREVGEDLDTNECFVSIHGRHEGAHNAEEYLVQLGHGWALDPTPLREAPPSGDTNGHQGSPDPGEE